MVCKQEMKRKRTIRIKDPRLRKIRNGLRSIIHFAESSYEVKLLQEEKELRESEGFWEKKHPNYEELHKTSQRLSSQRNKLSSVFSKSIIFCPVCMKMHKDMTYNPYYEEWLCMECSEANRVFYIEEGRPALYP